MTRKNPFLRTYTAIVALVCGTSVAYAIEVSRAAASADQTAWRTEAQHWHDVAQAAVTHDRAVMAQNHQLVLRYRDVVRQANGNARVRAAAATPAASFVAPATSVVAARTTTKTKTS